MNKFAPTNAMSPLTTTLSEVTSRVECQLYSPAAVDILTPAFTIGLDVGGRTTIEERIKPPRKGATQSIGDTLRDLGFDRP